MEVGTINLSREITERQRKIINLIFRNEPINEPINLSRTKMAKRLGLSVSTLRRELKTLENNEIIRFVGSKKAGHWEFDQKKTSLNCFEDDEKLGNELGEKLGEKLGNELGKKRMEILKAIVGNPKISTKQLAEMFGMSLSAMDRHLKYLKDKGFLKHVGPKNGGSWQVLESKDFSDEIE